jgi:tRNA-specific 2-thiouridylase
MLTPEGEHVGEHDGVMYYTLGQRSGLNIGGRRGASGEPWYVVGKHVADNVLYVAQGGQNRWLQCTRVAASGLSWVAGSAPGERLHCTAKTRYRQADQACSVHVDGDHAEIVFEQPQRAVTPGQSIVFYDDQACLGGGIIEATDAAFGGLTSATSLQTSHA